MKFKIQLSILLLVCLTTALIFGAVFAQDETIEIVLSEETINAEIVFSEMEDVPAEVTLPSEEDTLPAEEPLPTEEILTEEIGNDSQETPAEETPEETYYEEDPAEQELAVSAGTMNPKAGDDITYVYDSSFETLTFIGTGDIWEMSKFESDFPWYAHCDTIRKVVFTEGITSIPEYAFNWNYSELNELSFPVSIKKIGAFAFKHSGVSVITGLASSSLEEIGANAFQGCTKLTDFIFPASLKKIGIDSFHSSGLTALDLSNTQLEDIPMFAFCGCKDLAAVTFPVSLLTIGINAFGESFDGENLYPATAITSLDLSDTGVTSIASKAFYGCKKLTSFKASSALETLGDYCFAESGLKTVDLSQSAITQIVGSAFMSCLDMEDIYVHDSITKIEDDYIDSVSGKTYGAFANVPKSCYFHGTPGTYAIHWAFINLFRVDAGDNIICQLSNFDEYYLTLTFTGSGDLWTTDKYTYDKFPWHFKSLLIAKIEFANGITSIPDNMCTYEKTGESYYFHNLYFVTLPSNLKSIGDYAFAGSQCLTSISFPSSLEEIGKESFRESGITALNLGNTKLKDIPDWAFTGCTELTTVTFPSSLETIGESAFGSTMTGIPATAITNVDLSHTNVTSIGDMAFYSCQDLTTFKASPALSSLGLLCLGGSGLKTVDLSKSALTQIGNSAFMACLNMEDIYVHDGITNIQDDYYDTGWEMTMGAFAYVPKSCYFHGTVGTYAINWAVINGFRTDGGGTIAKVNLGQKAKEYAGYRVVVSKGPVILSEFKIEENKVEYNFILSEDNIGILTLEIFNLYDQRIAHATRGLAVDKSFTMIDSDYYDVANVSATVNDGSDRTADTVFKWNNEEGHTFPAGKSLKHVPCGTILTCTPDLEGVSFYPAALTIAVSQDQHEFNFTPIKDISLVGSVSDSVSGARISGAKIRIIQTLNEGSGDFDQVLEAVSSADGSYFISKVHNLAGKITVTAAGYAPFETTLTAGENVKIFSLMPDTVTLEIVQDNLTAAIDKELTLNVNFDSKNQPFTPVIKCLDAQLNEFTPGSGMSIQKISTTCQSVPADGKCTITVTGGASSVAYVQISAPEKDDNQNLLNAHDDICRVDFFNEEGVDVKQVVGSVKAIKLNPKKTDTVRIPVAVELNKDAEALNNENSLLKAAEFVPAAPFDITIADDMTLEVAPKDGAIFDKAYKGLRVKLTLNLGTVTEEKFLKDDKGIDLQIGISVDQSAPKVKVSDIKLNSAVVGDTADFAVKGETVEKIEVSNQPAWASVNEIGSSVRGLQYNGSDHTAKLAGTANLKLTLKGWKDPVNTTIKVTAAPSKPALTIKPSGESIRVDSHAIAYFDLIFKEAKYASQTIEMVSIKEGQSEWNAVSGSFSDAPLYVNRNGNRFLVTNGSKKATDGKDHTYTVSFKICDSVYSFPCKVLGTKKGTITTAVKGTIDLTIPGSFATYDVKKKDIKPDHPTVVQVFRNCDNKKNYCSNDNLVTDWFDATALANNILKPGVNFGMVTDAETSETVYDFKTTDTFMVRAYVCYDINSCNAEPLVDTDMLQTKCGALKIVQSLPSKVTPLLAGATVKGNLTVSNPQSYLTITPKFKNWPAYQADPADLVLFKNGVALPADAENPFSVTAEGDHLIIHRRAGKLLDAKAKYSFSLNIVMNGTLNVFPKKGSTAFKVAAEKATVKIDNKKVNLYKIDPAYTAPVTLTVKSPAGVSIRKVALNGKGSEDYQIHIGSDGRYHIGFKDATVKPNQLLAKSASLTIELWFDGDGSTLPSAKVPVSVTLK